MKILFLMDSPEYLRFFDTVIEELAARGHHVTLGVGWGREKKAVGLAGLHSHIAGVHVAGVVPQAEGVWADIGYGLRGVMATAFFGSISRTCRLARVVTWA